MKALTPPRLLAAAFAACSLLPSCQKNAQAKSDSIWWELESKRIALAHRVEVLEMRLSKIETARRGQEDVSEDHAATAEYRAGLEVYARELQEELAQQEAQLAAQKSEWVRKTRANAVGRTFDALAGADGRTFKEVVITRVTDVGVEFRHSTGTARLAAAQLSAAQQETFALDTAVAHVAIQEEKEVASAFGSWVDQGVAAAEEREEEARQLAENSAVSAAPVVRPSPLSGAPRSALRAEARPFGNGGSIWYPYSRTYRTRYYYTPSRSYYAVPSPCVRSSPAPNFRVATRSYTYSPTPAW